MIPGYHDHEHFVQAHRQNLLREAERERLLAALEGVDLSQLIRRREPAEKYRMLKVLLALD